MFTQTSSDGRANRPTGSTREILRRVLDAIPQRVFWKDRDSVYLGCNQRFADDAGLQEPAQIVGKTDFELPWRIHAERYRRDDHRLMESGQALLAFEEPLCGPTGQSMTLRTSKVPLRSDDGDVIGILGLYDDITQLREAEELLRLREAALMATESSVAILKRDGCLVWANPAFHRMTACLAGATLNGDNRFLDMGVQDSSERQRLRDTVLNGGTWKGEISHQRKDGSDLVVDVTVSGVPDTSGRINHVVAVKRDITERKAAERERAAMEIQVRHSQKLESMGRLAAGIAHEINTPTQYIGDNARFLRDAFEALTRLNEAYQRLLEGVRRGETPAALVQEIDTLSERLDTGFLLSEIPSAIRQSLEGVARVGKIVGAMKEFSHPGGSVKRPVDLNRAIQSTLTVSRNEWKYHADLVLDLDPALPLVPCLPDELNQVILNLVINAAHAIAARTTHGQAASKGVLTVSSRVVGGMVEVRVQDTGTGIPDEIRHRLFEPFFTTKAVGAGTGQGLAIARSVVVDKHQGTIDFESQVGQGTTFVIRLPLHPSCSDRDSSP